MSNKLINIHLNSFKDLNLNYSLETVKRNIIDAIVIKKNNGEKVDISEESKLTLNDIIEDKEKINLILTTEKKSDIKNKPIPGSRLIEKKGKIEIYNYSNEKFNDVEESSAINLLLIGENQSGKTSLINTFINAIMNIKIDDNFRYIITSHNSSIKENNNKDYFGTKGINIYNIKPYNNLPAIKIIDTPGFIGLEGINEDKITKNKIADTLKNNISYINAICVVVHFSITKLTDNLKYLFSNILDLFGEDVKENFFFILTFYDGSKPKIFSILEKKGSGFDKILPYIKGNLLYKFNNWVLYSEETDDELVNEIWKINTNNFKEIIKRLVQIPKKTLIQTNEVLKVSKSLENIIEDLSDKLKKGTIITKTIKQNLEKIQIAQLYINECKHFEYHYHRPCWKLVQNPVGKYSNNCFKCCCTCHDNCYEADGDNLEGCAAIDTKGYCTQCPGKCHYAFHKPSSYRYIEYKVEVVETVQCLKKKYDDNKDILNKVNKINDKLKKEFKELISDLIYKKEEMTNIVDKLEKISINSFKIEKLRKIIDSIKLGKFDKNQNIDNLDEIQEIIENLKYLKNIESYNTE